MPITGIKGIQGFTLQAVQGEVGKIPSQIAKGRIANLYVIIGVKVAGVADAVIVVVNSNSTSGLVTDPDPSSISAEAEAISHQADGL